MPQSLLNYRFRGTTLPYEELLSALENILIDKVTTHSASEVKKIDTSAPMETGMAARSGGEEAFEEGYGKPSEFTVQAVYKGTGAKGGWNGGKGPNLECTEKLQQLARVNKGANRAGKGQWSKTRGKKGGKGQEKDCLSRSLLELWETWTHRGKLHQGELERESERCRRRQRRHQ